MGEKNEVAISRTDFDRFINLLLGMPANRPWRGYGSAIFLELGNLRRVRRRVGNRQGHYVFGDATVMIEWDWRVEDATKILFASNSEDAEFAAGLKSLRRRHIVSIALTGRVPELEVMFDDDRCLRTFATVPNRPRWALHVPDGSLIYISEATGELVRRLGSDD